jgi:hypothetical protein
MVGTYEMIAPFLCRQIDSVDLVMQTFEEFYLVFRNIKVL